MKILPFIFLLFGISGILGQQFIILPSEHNATLEDAAKTTNYCQVIPIESDYNPYFPTNQLIKTVCEKWNENTFEKNDNETRETLSNLAFEEAAMTEEIKENTAQLYQILDDHQMRITELYNYEQDEVEDAWLGVHDKQLKCTKNNKLELRVCGKYNGERKRGQHRYVAPIGKFSTFISTYKHDAIYEDAVMFGDEIISASSCRFLHSHFQCIYSETMKCTIQNHTNCRELNRVAKHKVYQRRYGQYTMVAADVDEYQTVIGSNVTTHKMGASKHVVLRLPTGTYANFNNVKVFGNASDSFDHFTVHNPALSFDTNGNDLDILDPEREKQEEKDNHRPLVKPIDAWDLDTIIFWLIVFLVVIGALTTGIYLLYRSKVRNDIRDLHEEFEFFYKGEPRE